uniref:Uncharacterized protein n=1 Tax=Ciona savignyi TaxID=51511 RepID=H2ZER7_CIOSA
METPSSAANFYSNPMNLATMQMALGDNPFQAQLVSQAAMFGASPTAYGTFLPGGFGLGHSISSDPSIPMEQDNQGVSSGRIRSVSPSSSSHSFKDDNRENHGFGFKGTGKLDNQSEAVLSGNSIENQFHSPRTSKTESSESHQFESSPVRSRDDDAEGSGGSMLSDASTGEDADKPMNLQNLTNGDSPSLQQRPGMLSARGSFTMLHDQSAAE